MPTHFLPEGQQQTRTTPGYLEGGCSCLDCCVSRFSEQIIITMKKRISDKNETSPITKKEPTKMGKPIFEIQVSCTAKANATEFRIKSKDFGEIMNNMDAFARKTLFEQTWVTVTGNYAPTWINDYSLIMRPDLAADEWCNFKIHTPISLELVKDFLGNLKKVIRKILETNLTSYKLGFIISDATASVSNVLG